MCSVLVCLIFVLFFFLSLSLLKPKIWTFRSTRFAYFSDGHLSDTLNRKPPLFITSPLTFTVTATPAPCPRPSHPYPSQDPLFIFPSSPSFLPRCLDRNARFLPSFFWRANAMYCVVGMCYVLASFPTFHFQFLSFIACIFSSFLHFLRSCVCGVFGFWVFCWHTIRLVSACLRLLFAAITSLHRIARLYTIITHGTVFAKHMHAIPLPVVYSLSLLVFFCFLSLAF